MNFYHILILIISTITLYLLSDSYAKTLLNHDQVLHNQTMTESYNQINDAVYNDIYENGIEVSENIDSNQNPDHFINLNKESKLKRNKRRVEEYLTELLNKINNIKIKVEDLIKEPNANFDIHVFGCDEDIQFTNKYVGSDIHTVFTKCDEIIMVKQWANLTLETYLPVDKCQKYFQVSVLRDINNIDIDRKIFNVRNLVIDPFHLDYTRIVKKLNAIIKRQFNNEYIMSNYFKACRLNRSCVNKAKRNNITIETLVTEYSKLRKDTIRRSYLYETVLLTDLHPYNNFFKRYESVRDTIEVDILNYVKIKDMDFLDFLINEEIKRCIFFSFNYSFIFPLFDSKFLIMDDIIKLILTTNTGVEAVQHYEIYNFYDLEEYASIWFYVKPVKKCLGFFCIVLVPSKIVIGIDGISDINYTLFNGKKFTDSPVLHYQGNESEIERFYGDNLEKAETHGLHAVDFFSKIFKETNVYKNLINITLKDSSFNNYGCIKYTLSLDEFLKQYYYRHFKPSKECSNSLSLNQEKYKNYLLKLY